MFRWGTDFAEKGKGTREEQRGVICVQFFFFSLLLSIFAPCPVYHILIHVTAETRFTGTLVLQFTESPICAPHIVLKS